MKLTLYFSGNNLPSSNLAKSQVEKWNFLNCTDLDCVLNSLIRKVLHLIRLYFILKLIHRSFGVVVRDPSTLYFWDTYRRNRFVRQRTSSQAALRSTSVSLPITKIFPQFFVSRAVEMLLFCTHYLRVWSRKVVNVYLKVSYFPLLFGNLHRICIEIPTNY